VHSGPAACGAGAAYTCVSDAKAYDAAVQHCQTLGGEMASWDADQEDILKCYNSNSKAEMWIKDTGGNRLDTVWDSKACRDCSNNPELKPFLCRAQAAAGAFPTEGLVFSIRADESTSGETIVDSATGVQISGKSITSEDGYECWDLDNDFLERSGGATLTEGQYYTHAVWVKWRETDTGFRTLFRPGVDHSVIVSDGTKDLGMWCNRGGGFRDSGYDITDDLSTWQLVIVTGSGSSPSASTGTSSFYTGALGSDSVTIRGTADKVVCGMAWSKLGYEGQGPGKVAAAYEWNRILTTSEMNQILQGTPTQASVVTATTPVWSQLGPDNQKCITGGQSNIRGLTQQACQQRAETAGYSYYQYAATANGQSACKKVDSCDSPITGTSWDWKVFKKDVRPDALLSEVEAEVNASKAKTVKSASRRRKKSQKQAKLQTDSLYLRKELPGR